MTLQFEYEMLPIGLHIDGWYPERVSFGLLEDVLGRVAYTEKVSYQGHVLKVMLVPGPFASCLL